MVYITDKETHETLIEENKKRMEKIRIERKINEVTIAKALEEVRKFEKEHGYIFWRHN